MIHTIQVHGSHDLAAPKTIYDCTRCRRCGMIVGNHKIADPCPGAPAVPHTSHAAVTGVSFDPEACQLTVEKGPSPGLTAEQQVRLTLIREFVAKYATLPQPSFFADVEAYAQFVLTGKTPS